MSGCYGNSPEDKYFENKMLNELSDEYQCANCGGYFEMGGYEVDGELWCDDCIED